MFEHDAIYGIITYVGNANLPEEPASRYSEKAGGNADTDQKYRQRKAEYEALMVRRKRWFDESRTMVKYMHNMYTDGRWSKSQRSSRRFFFNSDEWADIFIKDVFGSVDAAYWKTETKEELADCFLQWFERKRKELRKTMNNDMKVIDTKAEVMKISGRNITHGGIANLLKVLTKTMEKQGADIRSIAKVQYTICKQAGILIPDEFIEDVAVILTQEV